MKIAEIKNYLYGLRFYIFFSFFFLLFSILSGYLLAQSFPEEVERVIENLREIFLPIEEASSVDLFLFILGNNIIKLFIILALSILAGLASLFAVFSNGLILGIFAQVVSEKVSWQYFAAGVLPHGILELTVLILSTAIGLRIGKVAVWKLFSKKESLTSELANGLRFYIVVLVPLLLVAALIEAFITPFIMSFFTPA